MPHFFLPVAWPFLPEHTLTPDNCALIIVPEVFTLYLIFLSTYLPARGASSELEDWMAMTTAWI